MNTIEYTINKIAQLSGISARALRYYDEINLLKPARINSSGYRLYGEKEIDLLQQILFYRSLNVQLEEIKTILTAPHYNVPEALAEHLQKLLLKRAEIDRLIEAVKKTINHHNGEVTMTNQDKFSVFKQDLVNENELKYGKEIRKRYGENVINASNKKWLKLSEDQFRKMDMIEERLIAGLKQLKKHGEIPSPEAEAVFKDHKAWLMFSWASYSSEAHKRLTDMYIADQRFAYYYNQKANTEVTTLLHEVVHFYAT
ncbi:DNA-binding transcriptional regulator, MerR family [Amphibacillus marinus]|uniref:DNA-binding transcriptional regulator, MerR family n=1 Tax=Amphibacillus marinus TaxID=872970 RepID=A0A1H8JLP6_9BACI|nr:MerR family transcriptional regulator [Amphibacillus marinus]SEN81592.1 DNA-binding transcriptional regulator, MerR family [Amphibacillus marinus]